ncbi:putative ATP-dependent helicase [Arthrobacter globiformis NBRC 12137]|uniref:Putative ATP-dependent helicase n=1 Tax=Arthrobacter globiformis (strain ATCC 8010 / DSM 20124 / JCM 1332 / NBRC 12137 / NCIMB 8907 / NRRL B-2979 / 168) TaxID=1077972 RepID=H0QS84_ARTG1|nr:putative ATP-dependent helicase [Arthrobacter globiformis NBRC 12137]
MTSAPRPHDAPIDAPIDALGRSAPFDLQAIGSGLVFAESLGALGGVLREQGADGAAVVQAPPGTGKTTLVPPLVANLAQAAAGDRKPRIVVTQPRRVAARSAARRLADLDGTKLGDRVGYTVRGERQAGPATLIEFVTPGILLRRLLADPGLEGTAAVILDEVHERGLETDLLLGLLAEVRQLRGDLMLVAMSATLDAPRFAALLGTDPGGEQTQGADGGGEQTQGADGGGPAPVVDCPSALHPLETAWTPAPVARLDGRGVTRLFLDHVAETAAVSYADALAADPRIDALVFLPGAWEVSHVAGRLRARVGPGVEILELHGQVSPAAQNRAVSGRKPGDPARIIVSTGLAESSLTVPGVRLVVDAGLSREPRRDAGRGMTGLVTVSCSRASAEQRAGRAARQGPGKVVRCYDQKTLGAAPAHQTPEIAVSDLTGAALILACWGSPGGRGLALPDAPPQAAMGDAVEVLRELGAVGEDGLATDLGKALARIPADPRLGRALLVGSALLGGANAGRTGSGTTGNATAASGAGSNRLAAEVVAAVAGDQRATGADLPRLVSALRSGKDPASRRWADEARRLDTLARQAGSGVGLSSVDMPVVDMPVLDVPAGTAEQIGLVVALAFPDRVARRVPGDGPERYLLTSGTRAGLPAGSPLAGHEWLAVAEVARADGRDAAGTGAVIRSAAPLTADTAEGAAAHLLLDSVEATFGHGRVTARRERRLGAISLSSTPVRASAGAGRAAVARALEEQGLGTIGWSTAADALRRRLALLHRELGDPWPDMSEPALLSRLDDWLGPELEALAGGAATSGIDLADPLRRLLPWPDAARLGELAPEFLEVPSGSRVRIDYPAAGDDGGRPVVAVKLQECFGWDRTPLLAGGRVAVQFHLLSPARRPLAVTDDLASFWSGPYAQVRAEMRGRYPKHPWPEDPWTATATARTNTRK